MNKNIWWYLLLFKILLELMQYFW